VRAILFCDCVFIMCYMYRFVRPDVCARVFGVSVCFWFLLLVCDSVCEVCV